MSESPETRVARHTPPVAGPSGLRVRVFAAADAILRSGRRPTIESIRQQLGGGSQTTLMAHLNDWYRELGERLAAAETPLAGMPSEASHVLQQLWRVASKAGQTDRRTQDEEAGVVQRMLEAERDGLLAQNKALETLNGELKNQRRNSETMLSETRALLSRREAELAEERSLRSEAEQALARAVLDKEVLQARQSARRAIRPLTANQRSKPTILRSTEKKVRQRKARRGVKARLITRRPPRSKAGRGKRRRGARSS